MRSFPPVSLVGAPTDVGAGHRGALMGPEALRIAGLLEALRDRGIDVVDRGNLDGPRNPWQEPVEGYRHLEEVVAWNRAVMDGVRRRTAPRAAADPDGRRPLSRHRFDHGRRAPLPRDRQAAARAVAGCTRRLQHPRRDAVGQHPRHAGRLPVRHRPAGIDRARRLRARGAAVGNPADRHPLGGSGREAADQGARARRLRHALHRRSRHEARDGGGARRRRRQHPRACQFRRGLPRPEHRARRRHRWCPVARTIARRSW